MQTLERKFTYKIFRNGKYENWSVYGLFYTKMIFVCWGILYRIYLDVLHSLLLASDPVLNAFMIVFAEFGFFSKYISLVVFIFFFVMLRGEGGVGFLNSCLYKVLKGLVSGIVSV